MSASAPLFKPPRLKTELFSKDRILKTLESAPMADFEQEVTGGNRRELANQ